MSSTKCPLVSLKVLVRLKRPKDQEDSAFIRVPFLYCDFFVTLFAISVPHTTVSPIVQCTVYYVQYTVLAGDSNTTLYRSVCPADCFDTVSMKCSLSLDKPPEITVFIC